MGDTGGTNLMLVARAEQHHVPGGSWPGGNCCHPEKRGGRSGTATVWGGRIRGRIRRKGNKTERNRGKQTEQRIFWALPVQLS